MRAVTVEPIRSLAREPVRLFEGLITPTVPPSPSHHVIASGVKQLFYNEIWINKNLKGTMVEQILSGIVWIRKVGNFAKQREKKADKNKSVSIY